VLIADPAIEATVLSPTSLPLGSEVQVQLVTADIASRVVAFKLDEQFKK
jgi:hypothetical protein